MDERLLAEARQLHLRILEHPERKREIIQEFYSEKVAAGQGDEANLILIIKDIDMVGTSNNQIPKWLVPVGVGFGLLTFVFLIAIVLLSIAGHDVSSQGKFALVGTMAFGAAFSAAAWIGTIALSGDVAPNSQKPMSP